MRPQDHGEARLRPRQAIRGLSQTAPTGPIKCDAAKAMMKIFAASRIPNHRMASGKSASGEIVARVRRADRKVADEPDARHRGTECHADRDSDSKAANDAEQACIERLR